MMERKMMSLVVLALLASGFAAAAVVDNFDSYSVGPIVGPWAEVQNLGTPVATIGADGGNQFLNVNVNPTVNSTHVVYRDIPAIANADTATTLFARFRANTGTQNTSFGLSALSGATLATSFGFSNFQPQLRITNATINSVSVPCFSVQNGNGSGNSSAWTTNYAVTVGQWYNVWAVINQSTDKYDVYLTTGNNDALTPANILYTKTNNGFRSAASTADIVSFLAMPQGNGGTLVDCSLSFDDVRITSGTDLTLVPEPVTMVLLGLGGLMLRNRKW